ncbi:MAG: hypothetical protein GY694_10925 [Gammaproteobacteria bacterium]|nr:hypothetical protein [Gammaproteobacteria bacterium]
MLLSLGCKTMREGVVVTIIFFIMGVFTVLAGVNIVPELWHLNHIVILTGFILLLLAPTILVSTFLLSVLPKAKERMDKCEH